MLVDPQAYMEHPQGFSRFLFKLSRASRPKLLCTLDISMTVVEHLILVRINR